VLWTAASGQQGGKQCWQESALLKLEVTRLAKVRLVVWHRVLSQFGHDMDCSVTQAMLFGQ
jgi:hypothetical protein